MHASSASQTSDGQPFSSFSFQSRPPLSSFSLNCRRPPTQAHPPPRNSGTPRDTSERQQARQDHKHTKRHDYLVSNRNWRNWEAGAGVKPSSTVLLASRSGPGWEDKDTWGGGGILCPETPPTQTKKEGPKTHRNSRQPARTGRPRRYV